MARRHLDAVKITANVAVVIAASTYYLLRANPTTCDSYAHVLIAIGANILGLIQNPPTKPNPQGLVLPDS